MGLILSMTKFWVNILLDIDRLSSLGYLSIFIDRGILEYLDNVKTPVITHGFFK